MLRFNHLCYNIVVNIIVFKMNIKKKGANTIMLVRNNLRILMARDRLTIQDVHEKTGLSRTTISKLYNESSTKIGMDTIVELCKLFHCGVQDLLYLEDVKE
jgi:putative transcriptional regulator